MTDIEQTLQQAVNLHVSGRLQEAEELYRRILAVAPDQPDAVHFMGVLNYRYGNLEQARAYIAKAIELAPENAGCYTNMGNVFQKAKDHEAAVPWYEKSLQLNPDNKMAYSNLGVALTKLGKYPEAMQAFDRAIDLDPQYVEALCNQCEALKLMGEYDAAEARYRTALGIAPDYVQAHWNLSTLLLLKGDFQNGFKAYEWRWKRVNTPRRAIDAGQEWQGQDLDGKTLFVYEEQGMGDTLQFMRYLPMLQQLGGRVIFEVLPPLVRLVADYKGFDRLWVAQRNVDTRPCDRFDFHVPLMSLPGLLGTRLETVPDTIPYLEADAALSGIWKKRMGAEGKFKVGLVWAGHPEHDNDRNRSLHLGRFAPLKQAGNIALFSLQKEKYDRWTDVDPKTLFHKDLGEEIVDFADTAAIIDNLDLVVSVDTSVVHLAGAMGKAVWVLLPFSPDWRWLLDRTDSPWYPTMKLFRQPAPGDWQPAIDGLRQELSGLAG